MLSPSSPLAAARTPYPRIPSRYSVITLRKFKSSSTRSTFDVAPVTSGAATRGASAASTASGPHGEATASTGSSTHGSALASTGSTTGGAGANRVGGSEGGSAKRAEGSIGDEVLVRAGAGASEANRTSAA